MLLTIIIVNYNVKYFLEQCLFSVDKALRAAGLTLQANGSDDGPGEAAGAEVFVVDNHSSDGSEDYLLSKFSGTGLPGIRFIFNKENLGFGAANNLALSQARGEYVLFLNPDTILPEDLFSVGLSFMQDHPRAGAAGFRMIDGGGVFLKESKRGYPSPWVAFCKLSGLAAVFPRSAFFAGYYLGHLPEDRTAAVPILSGACMLVREAALDRTGGFDERFFMYAEDIDLSYRIEQAGFMNYYIADTTLLHFKGESTRKDRRYIRLFYMAMTQFRRKHAGNGFDRAANVLMDAAIWMRAALAVLRPAGRTSSPRASATDRIVLHEGKDYSFKQIISLLQEKGRRAGHRIVYMIHASGSGSIVGSLSKEGQGEAEAI